MANKILIKTLDLFYNKTKFYLVLLFISGFIIRLFAARNIGISADDVNHALRPIGIFGSGKLVIWDQSTALWYYIQGVFYKIFGPSMIGSRFASVVFGSLLIILMFLFVKRVFKSEKAALISSALVAFSPLLIKSTLPEMDVAASFFILLSAYFLFGYLELKKRRNLVLSAVIIGIASMIKLYSLFFAFSFILFLIYRELKSEKETKKILKRVLVYGLIITALVIPTLAHNYLLYQDKGIMDFIFSNTLKIGFNKSAEYYSWAAGWNLPGDYGGFFLGNQQNFEPTPLPGFLIVLGFIFKGDPLLFILGLFGLIYAFKKHREYFTFFLFAFIPAFIYLGVQIPMAKHFIWGIALISPLAGLFVSDISSKFKKIRLRHVLVVLILFNLLYLGMPKDVAHAHVYGESSFGQLVDFKSKIPSNALVVVDSRIYRGNMHFALAGTNYIEAAQFFDVANQLNQKGNLRNIEVYYVECVIDDCGWGTIGSQPEFNQSMEQITAWFANSSYYHEDFSAPNPNKYSLPFIGEDRTDYRVYKADLALNPDILKLVKQTHVWFMYPVGYDRTISEIFDDYYPEGFFQNLINKTAWFIFYLELSISFLAIIYILYIFINE